MRFGMVSASIPGGSLCGVCELREDLGPETGPEILRGLFPAKDAPRKVWKGCIMGFGT